MKGYRVVFDAPCKASLHEFEVRQPGAYEVQIKVYYTLISAGTEKAQVSGSKNTARKFPAVPGYSSAGVVTAIGSSVTEFAVGDRVFAEYGGHASYCVQKTSKVVKIPDNVSFQEAVFTRVASFPLLALRRARLEIGESVVVVGLGMLGLFGVQLARAAGAFPTIAIGTSTRPIRNEKAKEYGADLVVISKRLTDILSEKEINKLSAEEKEQRQKELKRELIKEIKEYTMKTNCVSGANVVLEVSGNEDGFKTCLNYVSKRGRVVVNGCNRDDIHGFDLYGVMKNGTNIIGAHDMTRMPYNSAPGNWTAKRDYITLLGFMSDGRLKTKDMISEYASPADCGKVYERLVNDRNFPLGVLFDWEHFDS